MEIAAHAFKDGVGKFFALRRVAQTFFLGRIGDEGRFHQDRRHIRRTQDNKVSFFHISTMRRSDPAQCVQHLVGDRAAGLQSSALRQVQQHRGQRIVLVVQRYATDQIGTVLPIRQPVRGFAGGAARGQHPDRGTTRIAAGKGVGMDRNEQIRLGVARDLVTVLQRNEAVAVAGQHRTHAGLLVDQRLEFARHGQGDFFFMRSGAAGRARIHAAMTGIQGDHHVCAVWPPARWHSSLSHAVPCSWDTNPQ